MNTFCDTSWCVLFNLCDRPVFIDVLHLGQHQLESLSVSTHFISAGESLVQYFTAVDPLLGDKDSLPRWLLLKKLHMQLNVPHVEKVCVKDGPHTCVVEGLMPD